MPFLRREVQKVQFEVEAQRETIRESQDDSEGITDHDPIDDADNSNFQKG